MAPVKDRGRRALVALAGLVILGSLAPAGAQQVGPYRTGAMASADAADNMATRLAPALPDGAAPIGPRPGPGPRWQPAPAIPPVPTPQAGSEQPPPGSLAALFVRTPGSERGPRLAGTPNMFGNLLTLGGDLVVIESLPNGINTATADLPLAASRRLQIGEDNNVLTQDRVHFEYNHFQNALLVDTGQLSPTPIQRTFSVDRYTIGLEKTLLDRSWSVELRMPLAGEVGLTEPDFRVSGGQVGNLVIVLKRMVYECEETAACVGLGIGTPTGSDVHGFALNTDFTLHNDAVHLVPYAGLLRRPSDRVFYQGFVQVDVPTRGDAVSFSDIRGGTGTWGSLNEQTLLQCDLSVGYWLYRNPYEGRLSGLAFLTELHYTTTLQDADSVTGLGTRTAFAFGNSANRVDIVDLTVGLHAEIGERTTCRVAGVVPLRRNDDRSFDSEVQVQLERRF